MVQRTPSSTCGWSLQRTPTLAWDLLYTKRLTLAQVAEKMGYTSQNSVRCLIRSLPHTREAYDDYMREKRSQHIHRPCRCPLCRAVE